MYSYIIQPGDYPALLKDFDNNLLNITQLGKKWGVSRERIRQLHQMLLGKPTMGRRKQRTVIQASDNLPKFKYSQYIKSVWNAATAAGLEVKAYRMGGATNRRINPNYLFINKRMCRIGHSTSKWQPYPNAPAYVHLGSGKRKETRIYVVTFLDPPVFYVFPRDVELGEHFYIPLESTNGKGRPPLMDFNPYKNAWNLLR